MSANTLPDWRVLLRGARQREGRSPGARWLQLASVGTDGTPRVRTLVFRGWADAVRRRRNKTNEEEEEKGGSGG